MDTSERLWLEGFANGLLFIQAHNDVPGGQQTLTTHFPDEWWNPHTKTWVKFYDFEFKLTQVIHELDEEGGIVSFRFKNVKDKQYNIDIRVIELGSSEGYFGSPDWND